MAGAAVIVVVSLLVMRSCADATTNEPSDASQVVHDENQAAPPTRRATQRQRVTPTPWTASRLPAATYDTYIGMDAPGARSSNELWFDCVVCDIHGAPIAGATVVTQSTRVMAVDGVIENRRRPRTGFGLTASYSVNRERGVTSFGRSAKSGVDGRAHVPVAEEGRTAVFVWAEGFRPATVQLGWMDLSRSGARIVLEAAPEDGWVQIRAGGEPVGLCWVRVVPLDGGDAQAGIEIESDLEGRVPTEWLVPGQMYWLSVGLPRPTGKGSAGDPRPGFIVWHEREALDVTRDLSRRMPPDSNAAWLARQDQLRARYPARQPPALE